MFNFDAIEIVFTYYIVYSRLMYLTGFSLINIINIYINTNERLNSEIQDITF